MKSIRSSWLSWYPEVWEYNIMRQYLLFYTTQLKYKITSSDEIYPFIHVTFKSTFLEWNIIP